ncbi:MULTISPECIES: carbohydrate kinase [Acetobacter]|uniref:Carbohydrate kinase PfkB domain-containing protein n=1 Tax=Acetobacter tropicalis TaxID=104102 RepID=A0A291PFI6_9PROT|nr:MULTISPECIES: carbohydrate kinase [Acetobacter]ATJ90229.1 hypothetical protein CIW82_05500 [Acetobacter tropicalis]
MTSDKVLNDQEKLILDCIERNPFISQQDLAEHCGLARPTVATYIAQLTRKGFLLGRAYVFARSERIVCIGGAAIDRKYRLAGPMIGGTSNPASGSSTFGGVARNVSENLARLGTNTNLVSVVGDDEDGQTLVEYLRNAGVDVSGVQTQHGAATAEYVAVLQEDNDLAVGIVNAEIFETVSVDTLRACWPTIVSANWVFADCNLPTEVLAWLSGQRADNRFRLAIGTVSAHKAQKLRGLLDGIDLLFTTDRDADVLKSELKLMSRGNRKQGRDQEPDERNSRAVVCFHGPGSLTVTTSESTHRLAVPVGGVADVTGAADALAAGTLSSLLSGDSLMEACRFGIGMAALTATTHSNVHPLLTRSYVEDLMPH